MIPASESLCFELKSDRKRLPDAELVEPLVWLAYIACSLTASAKNLCHQAAPFPFNPERRAQLRYILNPADVMGDDYPSETFRVLKNGELSEFEEYRAQRLVLAAWDALHSGDAE